MAVTMEQIKDLRERTGISISACKKALDEADGDMEKAIENLRKKGEAKAAARAERGTAFGVVATEIGDGKAAIVELRCETDFVAMDGSFVELASTLAKRALAGEVKDGDDLEEIKEAGLRLGENIQLGAVKVLEGGTIGSYIHSNRKIGTLVALDGGSEDLAKDLAMHAAATSPAVISPDEVSDDLVAKEKEIWTEQLKNEGKPEEIIEKIMMGKEKKFREEAAFVKQSFVKDPEKTVEQLLEAAGAKMTGFVKLG